MTHRPSQTHTDTWFCLRGPSFSLVACFGASFGAETSQTPRYHEVTGVNLDRKLLWQNYKICQAGCKDPSTIWDLGNCHIC